MAAITVRLAHEQDALRDEVTGARHTIRDFPHREVVVARGYVPLTLTDDGEEAEAVVVMRKTGSSPPEEVQARPVALLSLEDEDAWHAAVLCVADNLQAAGTESTSPRQVQAVLDEAFDAYLHFTGCPD
jgi:inorganic pyrophosphatase